MFLDGKFIVDSNLRATIDSNAQPTFKNEKYI
jgi:hypothetical protein